MTVSRAPLWLAVLNRVRLPVAWQAARPWRPAPCRWRGGRAVVTCPPSGDVARGCRRWRRVARCVQVPVAGAASSARPTNASVHSTSLAAWHATSRVLARHAGNPKGGLRHGGNLGRPCWCHPSARARERLPDRVPADPLPTRPPSAPARALRAPNAAARHVAGPRKRVGRANVGASNRRTVVIPHEVPPARPCPGWESCCAAAAAGPRETAANSQHSPPFVVVGLWAP